MPEFSRADYEHTERALELASMPVSAPHPNPRVGCVIVRDGKIVGEGFHRKAGQAHAEVNAFEDCGDLANNAELYVTLEPCDAYGRTPPCVDRVIQSGVKRVVICSRDPHPSTNGSGINKLREAGIVTDVGILEKKARSINRGFFSRLERGRPWVTVKVAATLDGRIATATGESAWITGEDSRNDVQLLRAQASVIMTGIGTVEADNPRLNCRAPGADSSPARVIVDSHLRLWPDSKLFSVEGQVIVAVKKESKFIVGSEVGEQAEIVEVSAGRGGVDCGELLNILAEREVNEILVEAGPKLVGTLLSERLADEMIVYMAPSYLGDTGRGIATIPEITKLSDRIDAKFTDIQRMGEDLRVTVRIDG